MRMSFTFMAATYSGTFSCTYPCNEDKLFSIKSSVFMLFK